MIGQSLYFDNLISRKIMFPCSRKCAQEINVKVGENKRILFDGKEYFSRLPISRREQMIALTLLKTILKFCTTDKLFKKKSLIHFFETWK